MPPKERKFVTVLFKLELAECKRLHQFIIQHIDRVEAEAGYRSLNGQAVVLIPRWLRKWLETGYISTVGIYQGPDVATGYLYRDRQVMDAPDNNVTVYHPDGPMLVGEARDLQFMTAIKFKDDATAQPKL